MTYLFLFTLGPVQSFIAQARKTLDLSLGSKLLAELTRTGIHRVNGLKDSTDWNALVQHSEVRIPYHQDDVESIPNKFLAEITFSRTPTEAEMEKLGKEIETQVGKRLLELSETARQRNSISSFQAFEDQIGSHLETYWLFEPLDRDADGNIDASTYQGHYQRIEQRLSIIKNTQNFMPIPGEERGRKCSVSGERDALIFGKFKQSDKEETLYLPRYADDKSKHVDKEEPYFVKGEGLSAICYTKRFWKEVPDGFPSTAKVALMRYLGEAEREEGVKGLITEFKCLFGRYFDEQLFFPENMTEKYFRKHGLSSHEKNREIFLSKLKVIRSHPDIQHLNPSPYYALIAFDGDHMGKLWGGNFLQDPQQLRAFQGDLTDCLGKFAAWAEGYLTPPSGQAVYAGGDDFLGFANLFSLFDVLQELRSQFEIQVNQVIQATYSLIGHHQLTFSAGVVLSHYKTPLGEVVKQSKRCEAAAKEQGGRDAFCLHVLKHSGEQQQALFKWNMKAKDSESGPKWESQTVADLDAVVKGLETDFSTTYITALTSEVRRLMGRNSHTEDPLLPELLCSEIAYLVRRSKKGKLPKERIDGMINIVTSLYKLDPSSPFNLIHALHLLQFIQTNTYEATLKSH